MPRPVTSRVLKAISIFLLICAFVILGRYLGVEGIAISSLIIIGAILVGYGADMLELVLPSGVAIAIVALLQISPEFFVEWATVKRAAADPNFLHNAMANLFGANKLLVGFGPPLVFFVYFFFSRYKKNNEIVFSPIKSYSIFVMVFAILYNYVIYLKNSLMWYDSIVLIVIYFASVFFIGRMEISYEKSNKTGSAEDDESHDSFVMRFLHSISKFKGEIVKTRVYLIALVFLLMGGGLLVGFSEHFLDTLLRASAAAGISTFFFIGYVAPFMSEFPEKTVAIGFAMKGREDTAMVNFLSSVLAQLTLLTGLVPLVYSYYKGSLTGIVFDHTQSQELLLVIAMMLFSFMLFSDLKFTVRETVLALGLFIWQFVSPESRDVVTKVYFVIFISYLLEMFLEKRHTEVFQVVADSVRGGKRQS